jgi:eukaryotic-like serine/threonine-protein kinase
MAKYRFGEVIGQGAFGEVLAAERVEDSLSFAVKRLKNNVSEDIAKRFVREVRLQAQIKHQNVTPIYGSNLTDSPPWFVMPLAKSNLAQTAQTENLETVLSHFMSALKGVRHIHGQGIVHRDLKPENILIFSSNTGKDQAAISDFGLGKHLNSTTAVLTVTGFGMGSPAYMAPEQFSDAKGATQTCDVYALGKILYYLLTKDVPMHPDYMKLPTGWRFVVEKCLQVKIENRFQKIDDLIDAVNLIIGPSEQFAAPIHTASEIINELNSGNVRRQLDLLNLFFNSLEDEALFLEMFHKIPQNAIVEFMEQYNSQKFVRCLEKFNELVSGTLSFNYCDVVANFYDCLYTLTTNHDTKLMILNTLVNIAYFHNRFHVAGVVSRLVSQLNDPDMVLQMRDFFSANRPQFDWLWPYMEGKSIPPILKALNTYTNSI